MFLFPKPIKFISSKMTVFDLKKIIRDEIWVKFFETKANPIFYVILKILISIYKIKYQKVKFLKFINGRYDME